MGRVKRINPPRSLKHQKGVVIVIALLIVALVVAMAYTMLSQLARDTRRTTLIVRDAEASGLAEGSVLWAKDQLQHNWEQQVPGQLIDRIPIQSPINEVNGYRVSSVILDAQSRLNVNNVNSGEFQTALIKLLQLAHPALTREQASSLVKSIAHWVGARGAGEHYAEYYLQLPEPYRPAYKPMVSVSELVLIKGMTPALYEQLKPLVTALPQDTLLNVQTAPVAVLAALSQTMTMDAARAIDASRRQKPITTMQQFSTLDAVKNHPDIKQDMLTVTSQYFLVETTVTIENQRLVLYTWLKRLVKDKKATVIVVQQSKGIV
jgi:general secretion pathway protein K